MIISNLEHLLVKNYYCLAPDLFERHSYISHFITAQDSVLDVGGEDKILKNRVGIEKYVTVNVASNEEHYNHFDTTDMENVLYDGKDLPFKDKAFDIVLCIDVLEHVPFEARTALIKEMLRVTNKMLICSAPFGTQEHIEGEKLLYKKLRSMNKSVEFLKEHISRGLPTPEEVSGWANRFSGMTTYSGNFKLSNFLLLLHIYEAKQPVINHLLFFVKMFINFFLNILVVPFLTGSKKYSSATNRFYLIINK